jgi:predicted nucleotidyltransferase
MGAKTPNLGDVLFTRTQQRVLALLFGNPGRSFHFSELVRLCGAGNGAVQRELGRLSGVGLLNVGAIGNQKHYQANRDAPVFEELRAIVLKTFGLGDALRHALRTLAPRVQVAFIYGSVAAGTDSAGSDIDLMLVSEKVGVGEVLEALAAVVPTPGREVNPAVYRRVEFERKASEEGGFLSRVLEGPKIFLIGSEHDLPEARKARPRR